MPAQVPSYPHAANLRSEGLKSFLARRSTAIRWISIAVLLASLAFLMRILPMERALGLLRNGIEGLGMGGPLALGALYVLATLLFIPGSLLTLASGALYGLALGTVVVSLSSTAGAALAFLIARYVARERVRQLIERSPGLAAVDEAIGQQGWKIVALLRLSPAVPFNLQNYLYGVTAIRFWPCVLVSWATMLPGTFMYVYIGSLGHSFTAGEQTSPAEWALRGAGLLATAIVTIFIARLARHAIRQRTDIEFDERRPDEQPGMSKFVHTDDGRATHELNWPWSSLIAAALAMATLSLTGWAIARQDMVRKSIERLLGAPPTVIATEAYEELPGGLTFDHSTLNAVLRMHVDPHGWVDYKGLQADSSQLDRYIEELANAPLDSLGRNERLALLINAYNAFTLRLILDHWPVSSIKDIPTGQRWDARRWRVGSQVWSLNEIEHEQIRPHFVEPRIHFALVCAAIGCPPLRNEAYTAQRLGVQLDEQADYVHAHPRWFRFDRQRGLVHLTRLYDWYGSDFTQQSPTVLQYSATYAPGLRQAFDAGERPTIRWLEYDWRLNSGENRNFE